MSVRNADWRTVSPHELAEALDVAVSGDRLAWGEFLAWAIGAGYVCVDAGGAPTHFRVPEEMAVEAVVAEYLTGGGRR